MFRNFLIKFQFLILSITIIIFNPLSAKFYTILYAQKYSLNKSIFYRQIKTESYFRCFIKSKKNAIGLGQVTYPTALYMNPKISKWQLYIPWKNLDISGRYMEYLLKRYKQNYSLALAAYNWGETNVDSQLKINGININSNINYQYLFKNVRETYIFIDKILD